jgi:hypothetical protein
MLLGSTVDAGGAVRHSRASKGYLVLQFALIAVMCGYVAANRYWFAIAFAARFLVATVRLCSGTVTERGHKRTFINLSNWEMAFLLSMYIWTLGTIALTQLIVLGAAIVLANVAYYHDERANRALMLRFRKAG